MNFYNSKGKRIKRHSIIALMLQELELKIFKQIWDTLNTIGIAFVTRHDSVVINENDLDNALYHINTILDEELVVNFEFKVQEY
jgi:Fe-S cluster biosynthesis and repair protein YggX